MFTVTKVLTIRKGKEVIEGECLSSDEKPVSYGNGSRLIEMDTSKVYFFDESGSTWRSWA